MAELTYHLLYHLWGLVLPLAEMMGKCHGWETSLYLAVATEKAYDIDLNRCNGEQVSPPWEGDSDLAQN